MILSIDDDCGTLKIGSPPETLPGIVESVEISGGLLLENAEVQGRSGRVKIVQGWDDFALSISVSLIDDPGANLTRWDLLRQITAAFKKVAPGGKPEVCTLSHPMVAAWGTRGFLFSNLKTVESRTRRKISVSLEFVEYDSSAGVVQERQAVAASEGGGPEAAKTEIVSDRQRRGLGSMEARYGER